MDFLDYFVEFAASVAQSGRGSFHREPLHAFGHPYGHPTWMPVVPPEVGDRLAAAGQIAHDEAAEGWTWRNDCIGALLALRRLEAGDPTQMEVWLSRTTARTSQGALALVADRLIEQPPTTRGELQPFLATEQGVDALGMAVTLRAPVSTGEASVADRTGFEANLDRIFGSPRELERSPARLEEARVLDDAQVRLAAFDAARPARRLLLQRMLYVNRRVLEMEPRHGGALMTVAKTHALLAGIETEPMAVLEGWAGAKVSWEWCAGSYSESLLGQSPFGVRCPGADGDRRVLRGGAWNSTYEPLCATVRCGESPDCRADDIRLRCAISVD